MNFFSDRELAQRFMDDEVPSRERFNYFMVATVLPILVTSNFFVSKTLVEIDGWSVAADVVFLAISVVGTVLCYRTNRRGDDREFIERSICIAFPVFIQALLLGIASIPICFLWIELASIYFSNLKEFPDSFHYLVFSIIFASYFYWRLNSSIRIAAGSA